MAEMNDPMNYKGMFLDAVRALAEIDALLGLPEDGCNDPQTTVSALKDLLAGLKEMQASRDQWVDAQYQAASLSSPGAAQTREVPPGWKLVPIEPTEDMILEGNKRTWPIPSKYAYRAMLEAAPASQPVDGVQGGA